MSLPHRAVVRRSYAVSSHVAGGGVSAAGALVQAFKMALLEDSALGRTERASKQSQLNIDWVH